MQKKANNKKVMTSLYIRQDLKQELNKIGREEDRSFGWLVNQAVEEFLKRRQHG